MARGTARFDKYQSTISGTRVPLAVARDNDSDVGVVLGVGVNSSGRAVVGAGQTGIIGVICTGEAMDVGDPVDVMKHGEIVGVPGLAAGTVYYADSTTGALTTTATSNVRVGHTVEAGRLVVNMGV